MAKPILCVDFDGVIHSYDSGWQGATVVADPPVPGALWWLANATMHFQVQIYSSRSDTADGRGAMREALMRWAKDPQHWPQGGGLPAFPIEDIGFAIRKPSAFLTIDDRAIQFNGDWSALDAKALLDFKPWNKRNG
jgi:hypothetical protein